MAHDSEPHYKVYTIPDNFIDEGRITAGMLSIRTRYLVEAVIYGLIFAVLSFFIPIHDINTRITVTIVVAGPAFGLGMSGINGEPVSVALKHIYTWWTTRQIMLYDDTHRVLINSPVDKMMNESAKGNTLAKQLEERRKKRMSERENREFILGKNFEFAADRDNTREYSTLEELIKSEIAKRQAALDSEEEDLIEITPDDIEDDFDAPIIEDDDSEDDTLSISSDDVGKEAEEALKGISDLNVDDLVSLQTSDSDDLLFPEEGE